jgi:hypothetical protein
MLRIGGYGTPLTAGIRSELTESDFGFGRLLGWRLCVPTPVDQVLITPVLRSDYGLSSGHCAGTERTGTPFV